MSIFRRSSGDVQKGNAPSAAAGAEVGQPVANPMHPNATPGVVPPPAAPLYSMRSPESADTSVTERMRVAREAQEAAAARVRQAIQGRVAAPPGVRRVPVRPAQQAVPMPHHAVYPHDPSDALACAQTGLLSLAWRWEQAGAPIRAIHAYVEVIERYPDTPVADAAVCDLVELSRKLTAEGQFHTALAIYDHLEHLA